VSGIDRVGIGHVIHNEGDNVVWVESGIQNHIMLIAESALLQTIDLLDELNLDSTYTRLKPSLMQVKPALTCHDWIRTEGVTTSQQWLSYIFPRLSGCMGMANLGSAAKNIHTAVRTIRKNPGCTTLLLKKVRNTSTL
jgi:hypothetical protein